MGRFSKVCATARSGASQEVAGALIKFVIARASAARARPYAAENRVAHRLHCLRHADATREEPPMNVAPYVPTELCPLTDSLTSSIRWRMRDYEAILRAELAILAGPDGASRPRLLRVASRPPDEN
jgi:hypothetical protein